MMDFLNAWNNFYSIVLLLHKASDQFILTIYTHNQIHLL